MRVLAVTKETNETRVSAGESRDFLIENGDLRLSIEGGAHARIFRVITSDADSTINAELVGEGASFEEYTILVCGGKQQSNIRSDITHSAPLTRSRVSQYGVIRGNARTQLPAVVRIKKTAPQSDTFLKQRVLLLEGSAAAYPNPSLEIDNNDVIAGHAAAVSPLDEEQLFYLRTRGFTEEQARRTLARAFIAGVLGKIPKAEAQKILRRI